MLVVVLFFGEQYYCFFIYNRVGGSVCVCFFLGVFWGYFEILSFGVFETFVF